MAFTKVAAAGINTGGSFVFKDINTTGIITASTIKVGSAVTIHTGGYLVGSSDLHSTGLTVQNVNASGVITATSFYGDGSNLSGVSGPDSVPGISTVGTSTFNNINASGVVTATSFYGDGSNLTGIDATALKDSGGNTKVQANTSGAVVTGVLTATSFSGDGSNITGLTRTLTVGVRVGSAMTVSISGTSFDVSGRSGNIAINI